MICMEDTNEIWKDIPGYEGLYQVSDQGRVRSLERISIVGNYPHKRIEPQRVLKPAGNGNGYRKVMLWKDGRSKQIYVHRLVYLAFNGTIPEGMEVNHINECRADNRICNLNIMTHEQNNNWGLHGQRIARAEGKPVNQIDADTNTVVAVHQSASEAARAVGGQVQNICKCCNTNRGKVKGYKWSWYSPTV